MIDNEFLEYQEFFTDMAKEFDRRFKGTKAFKNTIPLFLCTHLDVQKLDENVFKINSMQFSSMSYHDDALLIHCLEKYLADLIENNLEIVTAASFEKEKLH